MKALIREKLISEIKLAFKGVKLGNGVGLYEAMGIDDYLPRSEQLQLRLKDEKYYWSNISFSNIQDRSSSLSFFDAEGMRFHLPQFMIYDIISNHDTALFTLSYKLDTLESTNKFYLLNETQILAIIHYLDFLKINLETDYQNCALNPSDIEEDMDYKKIIPAIKYWVSRLKRK